MVSRISPHGAATIKFGSPLQEPPKLTQQESLTRDIPPPPLLQVLCRGATPKRAPGRWRGDLHAHLKSPEDPCAVVLLRCSLRRSSGYRMPFHLAACRSRTVNSLIAG